jgi:spore maturation protein B
MNSFFALVPVLIIGSVGIFALLRGVDVFAALTDGASEGLKTMARILPALLCLLPVIYMLRASGAVDALAQVFSPVLSALGLPAETVSLMLLRPLSGSGALAVGSELINTYGPDSLLGRTAAVMLGSTETTFYVVAVYFGAAGVKKTRHAIPAALCADLAGFLAAAWTTRLFWG